MPGTGASARADAKRLVEWARRRADKAALPEPSVAVRLPVLIVDDKSPGQIVLDGVSVRLQEKQYRLIRLLASAPGECVPYERIYRTLWGNTIVETNQIHFQKRRLLEAMAEHVPDRANLISTVPKRGFTLNLLADDVAFAPAAPSVAA